jgi:hypothetical protein
LEQVIVTLNAPSFNSHGRSVTPECIGSEAATLSALASAGIVFPFQAYRMLPERISVSRIDPHDWPLASP